jgi:hypothetical protein
MKPKFKTGEAARIYRLLDNMSSRDLIGRVGKIEEIDELANGCFNYILNGHLVHEEELSRVYAGVPFEQPRAEARVHVCYFCNEDPKYCPPTYVHVEGLDVWKDTISDERLRDSITWCLHWQPARLEEINMAETNPADDYFTCPSGHTHPKERFHSYVKTDVEDPDIAIIFTCPVGKQDHEFNLRKAVGAGMFTIDQAAKIRQQGILHREAFLESEERVRRHVRSE